MSERLNVDSFGGRSRPRNRADSILLVLVLQGAICLCWKSRHSRSWICRKWAGWLASFPKDREQTKRRNGVGSRITGRPHGLGRSEVTAQQPDYGEVQYPGWFGRLLGRLPKIVREANFAAAVQSLPAGSSITATDPDGNWILYQPTNGLPLIRLRASEAWLPNEPTPFRNETRDTGATIDPSGRVVVVEGLHRTRATARERILFPPELGSAAKAPGWLDFAFDPEALKDTPSSRAFAQLLGGDPDAPLVSAR